MTLSSLISSVPKAELHLHIEGSLEPSLMWSLAAKHKITLPYKNVAQIEAAYQFSNLQSFLDIYYAGASVLLEEDDFYALMWGYLCKCKQENIVHAEVMFDPQTHTQRGIGYDIFMPGFLKAIEKAHQQWGMSVKLILSFLRHLSEEDAFETLDQAKPYYRFIDAIGLDSSEKGHPPVKFRRVFAKVRRLGFRVVAHAGEEGPADYIWQAIHTLGVDRIDHGVRCLDDPALVAVLKTRQIPLTVCPLSNLKLKVISDMRQHSLFTLMNEDLLVTVNSDDPTYFGGYLNRNFDVLDESLGMTKPQLQRLIENSFNASFLTPDKKVYWINEVRRHFS